MLILLLVGAAYLSQMPTLLPGQAWLSEVGGTAELRGLGDAAWQILKEGAVLGQGDELRISEGCAVLSLFDGTRLALQPGVHLSLDILRSGLFGASYHIALQQLAGSVEYDVAPLRGAWCRFEAQTPTVLVTVQGTRFVITVETVEETTVTVLQGSVRLDSAQQSAVLVEREAAVVPARAPLVRLPTLTPTFTPVAILIHTAPPSAEPSVTPPATATATQMVEGAAPSAPRAVPTGTAVPSAVPTPTATVAITATQTVTRVVETPTPEALATAATDRVEFTGVIEAFPPDILGTWRIGGQDVLVRRTTQIRGTPAIGLRARVRCLVTAVSNVAQRGLVAETIDIEEPQPSPGQRPTATQWWDAITTLLPPPVQTMLPQLPTLPPHTPLIPPGILSTMVAWPTEHPTHSPRPTRTPRSRATTVSTPEASPTPGADVNAAPTATLPPVSILGP
jgi:hypothetical protein